jgi:CxxC-x17-CxxC domain-containing protein
MIINNLKDPIIKAFWVHEYEQWRDQFRNEAIAPIQNKVGQFLSTSIIRNIVGQQKSTIDIFKIMNEGKIFLVNASKGRIGEDNSALIGGMIITKIQLAAMERVRIPEEERKDFYLYVDEFQNFATSSFANILSEARKYRLNLVVAHQYIAQIENKDGPKVADAVFGNVGTMIIFRVGADDADFLKKEFEPEFTSQDLLSLPNFHIYLKLMIDGVTSRPFSATTLPPIKIEKSEGVKAKVIESSRKLYTRPREEVEKNISMWSGTLQTEDGESKYKADCSNCKKITMVPFEPKEGRPVYCRDCMVKIKSGELKPSHGYVANKNKENVLTEPLAVLGIEFSVDKNNTNKNNFKQNNPNNNHKKDNKFVKDVNSKEINKDRKGPSPLLRGLLDKIKNNKEIDEKILEPQKIEIKQEPVSLASLKENTENHDFSNKKNLNNREASEEKKASLKDLLSKVNSINPEKIQEKQGNNNILENQEKDEAPIVHDLNEIKQEEKKENVHLEAKEEIPLEKDTIEDLPKEEIKENPVETFETPIPQEKEEIKKEEDVDDSRKWSKKQNKKEVPEDVLKKILE